MNRLPSLFVSHGAPTWALEPGRAGAWLGALGRRLPRPEAVLVVSPHWLTRGVRVSLAAHPETLHDFGGFPPALRAIRYDAPGHPRLASEAIALLAAARWDVRPDLGRGLDHGAWVPLRHLYPQADAPVFQVSMPADLDEAGALRLGRTLAPLAGRGVLILGSGSVTHNLEDVFRVTAGPVAYAAEFAAWVRATVRSGELSRLASTMSLAPHARRAHPTPDHFLPLLVAAAAGGEGVRVEVLDGGITDRVLAMDAFVFGEVSAVK